jgi:hypothetical protein
MKRLVIDGPWVLDADGDWLLRDRGLIIARVDRRVQVTVEDAPLPLPTEPGERFWGARGNDPQQWWVTVVGSSDSLDAGGQRGTRVGYAPTDLRSGWSDVIWSDEVTLCGLVRLPDQEGYDAVQADRDGALYPEG